MSDRRRHPCAREGPAARAGPREPEKAMATEVIDFATVFVYREEAHPQELRQARERPAGAVPARDAARVVPRVPAGGHAAPTQRKNEGLQAAFTSIFPISSHSGNARLEFVELLAARAGVRRHRMPAARPHLLLGAARQGAPHPDGQGSAEGDGQGSEGAGGLHGRDPAHDRQRLVRHQRHRARDRLAAAPLARACSSSTTAARRTAPASSCSRRA